MKKLKQEIYSHKYYYLALFLLIVIGSWIRLTGTYTNSFAFTYDVGRDLLAVSAIVNQHKISLIGPTTGLPGLFYGPTWYGILILPFIIFKGNPQGINFFISILSVLIIPLSFVLGKNIKDRYFGIIFAGGVTFSQTLISDTNQIWSPNIIPFFIILSLFVFHKIIDKGTNARQKYISFFFLGVILSIIGDLEIVFGLLLLASFVISVVFILRKKIKLFEIILFGIGYLLIVSPRLLFETRHQFLMTRTILSVKGGGIVADAHTPLLTNAIDKAGVLFSLWTSSVANLPILGIAVLVVIISILIYSYKKFSYLEKSFLSLSLITVLVYFTGLMFFNHDIWSHYLVGVPLFYVLIFAVALASIKKIRIYLSILAVLIFIVNLNPTSFIKTFDLHPTWGDASVYRNQLITIDYVYKTANKNNFKYVLYTPPVHDYTYKYLFGWYGEYKYGYVPVEKAKLAFFILEPDLQYPFRLKDWLALREKDGRVVKQVKLNSGVIVQTRTY